MRFPFLATTAAILLGSSATTADAATYRFTYDFGSLGSVTALVEGDLQSDGDTVIVTDVFDAEFGATPVTIGFFMSYSGYGALGDPTPILSLSGSNVDIIACTDPGCVTGAGIVTNPLIFGIPTAAISSPTGSSMQPFDLAAYSFSVVPLPAGGALMLGALGLLAGAARRR